MGCAKPSFQSSRANAPAGAGAGAKLTEDEPASDAASPATKQSRRLNITTPYSLASCPRSAGLQATQSCYRSQMIGG